MTHLKSLAAPKHYPKKTTVFTVSPNPGPHPKKRSVPLLIFVRDWLKLAEESRTARRLIKAGKFFVDGRVVKDPKFPLGLMDVVSIPDLGEHYRLLLKPRKGLTHFRISEEESSFKICQVLRKNHVRGGGIALGLHDGRTILFKGDAVDEGRSYVILDSLKVSLPDQRILATAHLQVSAYGYIHSGYRAGLHGRILKLRRDVIFPDKPTATIATSEGEVTTLLRNIMPIGDDEPWVTLPP